LNQEEGKPMRQALRFWMVALVLAAKETDGIAVANCSTIPRRARGSERTEEASTGKNFLLFLWVAILTGFLVPWSAAVRQKTDEDDAQGELGFGEAATAADDDDKVRRAESQIRALFTRPGVEVFPLPGPDRRTSFFARTVPLHAEPGRLYTGIAAPGRSLKVILLRTTLPCSPPPKSAGTTRVVRKTRKTRPIRT
jgi:hypothetical protein